MFRHTQYPENIFLDRLQRKQSEFD